VRQPRSRALRRGGAAVLAALALVAACGGGGGGDDAGDDDRRDARGEGRGDDRGEGRGEGTGRGGEPAVILFSTEGNNLNAYEPDPPFRKQTVIHTVEDDPNGLDINGQVCFFPDGSGRFVAGEDTGQPERTPGWGIFQLEGDAVGELAAEEIGRLVPTYTGEDNPENYGCGVLADGRIVTSDVGNQVTGPASGQLIVWFPPFDRDEVDYCKLDVSLPTAGGIQVVGDELYVAAARPPGGGVFRFRGPFPTSADAAGGCGTVDGTGAPLANDVRKELFIPADEHVATPNAVVSSPDGGFYVSSAFTGVLAHYDAAGTFVRRVVTPPPDQPLGDTPYPTGSPMGVAVDPTTGTIYWADLGIAIRADGVGPVDGGGGVRRTVVDDAGAPQPAEVVDDGLDFPDGVGIYAPRP
jgi:hypothetical protein